MRGSGTNRSLFLLAVLSRQLAEQLKKLKAPQTPHKQWQQEVLRASVLQPALNEPFSSGGSRGTWRKVKEPGGTWRKVEKPGGT